MNILPWLDKLEDLNIDAILENSWQGITKPYYRVYPNYFIDEDGTELDRGASILKSEEACCCYLHAYGKSHLHKLRYALEDKFPYELLKKDIEIFDWGCGQGLGTLAVLEKLREKGMLAGVRGIQLTDASSVSTRIAENLISRLFPLPGIPLKILNRKLPQRNWDFLSIYPQAQTTLHIFSNILDLDQFSLEAMAATVSTNGDDCIILITGPYRQTGRIEQFIDYIKKRNVANFKIHEDFLAPAFGEFNNGRPYSCLIKIFSYTLGPDFVPF